MVQVHLWDTAGQDKYQCMSSQYYKRASGAILVFSLTDRESFESCKKWYDDLREHGEESVEVLLVGNKSDLKTQRQIESKEAQNFADERSITYMEMSVKNNTNVKQAFELIVNKIVSNLKRLESKSLSSFMTRKYSYAPRINENQGDGHKESISLRNPPQYLKDDSFMPKDKSCN